MLLCPATHERLSDWAPRPIECARYDETLDLAAAFVDLQDSLIAVKPLSDALRLSS